MVTTRAISNRTLNILKTLVVSNDDLLIQILSRLHAKSILRFKSVSKHWLSLLSDRYFTLMFDKLSVSRGLFFNDEYIPFDEAETQSSRPFRSLDFYPDPHGIRILQSCNGLLLCCSDNESEPGRKYYVFNPTTKQFVVIPPVGGEEVNVRNSYMGLAFHHTDCVHFKVVRVYPACPSRGRKSYQIQIYSSDTAEWKILFQSFPSGIHFSFSMNGVYWNGALYWGLVRYPFYFKLDEERLHSLTLPEYQEQIPRTTFFSPRYLGESRGHLNFVEKPRQEDPLHFNVYEMLNDHSGWLFKYQVKLHEFQAAYPHHDDFDIKFLDVVRDEKEEDTFMVVRIYQKIIRYNILEKTFKTIFDLNGSCGVKEKAHRYIETIGSF